MPFSKTRLRASSWTSRGQSVLGAASSDLIRFGESSGEFRETWESARLEPHEFIEAGDLVVVPLTQHLKGRGGIEVVARGHLCVDNPQRSNRAGHHVPRAAGSPRSRGPVGARRSRRLLSLRDTARAMSQENVEIVEPAMKRSTRQSWTPGRAHDPGRRVATRRGGRPEAQASIADTTESAAGTERIPRDLGSIRQTSPTNSSTLGDRRASCSSVHALPGRSGVEADLLRLTRVGTCEGASIALQYFSTRRSPRSRGAVGARRSRRLLSLRDTARAMSQENVEIVAPRLRRAGIGRDSDAMPSRIHRPRGSQWLEPGARRSPGPDAGGTLLRAVDGTGRDFKTLPMRDRDEIPRRWAIESSLRSSCVAARGAERARRCRTRAAHAELPRLRDGTVACDRVLRCHAEALEAVGLSEQDAHADS